MAQLIALRQRIKAIETIRKITHAMQLISMSSHSRLRQKKGYIEHYKNIVASLWCKVSTCTPDWQNRILARAINTQKLIIIIGAQKGLSGTFNTSLIRFFERDAKTIDTKTRIVTIGKHLTHQIDHLGFTVYASYNDFTIPQIAIIAQKLSDDIISKAYSSVMVYSSYSKTFFLQKQKKSIIIPYTQELTTQTCAIDCSDYGWEQNKEEILNYIMHLNINSALLDLLFDSLLAEQAARFISMESATRNAQNLLNEMRLEYNKRRQAQITSELTDLATTTFVAPK